jgi:L-lactate dehydrogenase complex protein LldF
MVTTVPMTHVAVMGIERLLPTVADLSVMLKLLPASATGQQLTSYVTLIQSPRQSADQDGPQERLVILVDNGRTQVVSSRFSEALLCIRCGACLNACPVFREIGEHAYASTYPGPIGSLVSPLLMGIDQRGHLAKASTLCGACMDACPVGIEFPKLLLEMRNAYNQQVKPNPYLHLALKLFTWLASHPTRFRLGQLLSVTTTRLLLKQDGWIREFPPPYSTWTATLVLRKYTAFLFFSANTGGF